MRFNPSYFKLQMRWLRSLIPVTYQSKLLGINEAPASHRRPAFGWSNSFPTNLSRTAAFLQLELFRVCCRCVEYIIR
ncbi:hypothetical protein DMB90_15670 [Raoultella planticola]|uniref:Uncharacterized protein n=1 Tax=Raoultella planticola TaxID=575 RepID=A0A5P6AAE7_RAOPL|nr:hypothetical protein DMB90_15670 [Raoultella planticola]